jgi:hypothetical protein
LPVQSIGNALLDGITTVTPTVRYLSLRSWILRSYIHSGGDDSWKSLSAFAKRIEAAIAYGNLLGSEPRAGVFGAVEARRAVAGGTDPLPLKGLIQGTAIGVFAGPSEQLGLSSSREGVPRISAERGDALGKLIEDAVASSPLGVMCSTGTPPDTATREMLAEFGRCVDLANIPSAERKLLTDILVPDDPTPRERPRIATYGILLDLAEQLPHRPDTDRLLQEAIAGRRGARPGIAAALDGWLAYASRDLLAVAHERAMAVLVEVLQIERKNGRALVEREDAIAMAVAQVRTRSSVLQTLGLLERGEDLLQVRASLLRDRLLARLQENAWLRSGILRWSGSPQLSEVGLIGLARMHNEDALALLPIVWWLAAHRFERVVDAQTDLTKAMNLHGPGRFGLVDVVQPLGTELAETRSYGEAIAELLGRTADQHLRICWTRMAFDPSRDPTVLGSEAGAWSIRRDREFRPGRTQSRIEQTTGWLHQLGLVSAEGLTQEGLALREKATRLAETLEVTHEPA